MFPGRHAPGHQHDGTGSTQRHNRTDRITPADAADRTGPAPRRHRSATGSLDLHV